MVQPLASGQGKSTGPHTHPPPPPPATRTAPQRHSILPCPGISWGLCSRDLLTSLCPALHLHSSLPTQASVPTVLPKNFLRANVCCSLCHWERNRGGGGGGHQHALGKSRFCEWTALWRATTSFFSALFFSRQIKMTLLTSLIPSSLVPRDSSDKGVWEEVTWPLGHFGVPLEDKSPSSSCQKRPALQAWPVAFWFWDKVLVISPAYRPRFTFSSPTWFKGAVFWSRAYLLYCVSPLGSKLTKRRGRSCFTPWKLRPCGTFGRGEKKTLISVWVAFEGKSWPEWEGTWKINVMGNRR